MNICKKLKVKCVSQGEPNAKEKLAIKKAIWNENDGEIMAALKKSEKVQNIVIPKLKKNKGTI